MATDNVNHPSHYTWLKEKCGVEVIDIARHLDFCTGNALKYLLRAGRKYDNECERKRKRVEDLRKARWYITELIKHAEEDAAERKHTIECRAAEDDWETWEVKK